MPLVRQPTTSYALPLLVLLLLRRYALIAATVRTCMPLPLLLCWSYDLPNAHANTSLLCTCTLPPLSSHAPSTVTVLLFSCPRVVYYVVRCFPVFRTDAPAAPTPSRRVSLTVFPSPHAHLLLRLGPDVLCRLSTTGRARRALYSRSIKFWRSSRP